MVSPRRKRSLITFLALPVRSNSSNSNFTKLVMPPCMGPLKAESPAFKHAPSEAPVEATTRTAKAEAFSS